jgi:hypothetical protein
MTELLPNHAAQSWYAVISFPGERDMSNRGKLGGSFFTLVFIGLVGFYNIARQPRFETFHTSDVLQLIATGICFGVALVALVNFFRGPRSS